MSLKEKIGFFTAGALAAGAKSFFYAFTIPTQVRNFLQRNRTYRSHKDYLINIVEKENREKSLKSYIDLGDIIGFGGGLIATMTYALKAEEQLFDGNPLMFYAWLLSNGISAGYETSRKVKNPMARP